MKSVLPKETEEFPKQIGHLRFPPPLETRRSLCGEMDVSQRHTQSEQTFKSSIFQQEKLITQTSFKENRKQSVFSK